MCSVARLQTDTQTGMKMTTVGTLSGFQEFFLLPIIKDRPNKYLPVTLAGNFFRPIYSLTTINNFIDSVKTQNVPRKEKLFSSSAI